MIMGVAVGDALGLPAQFYSRKVLDKYPLVKMVASEEGAAGTYSDDTAMTLCTLASFTENNWQLDLQDIMNRFIDWYGHGDGIPLDKCGGADEWDCGNGSLMRIAPVIFYLQRNAQADILKTVSTISSLTHAHQRCIMYCYIYVVLGLQLLKNPGQDKTELFKKTMPSLAANVKEKFAPDETGLLARLYDIEKFINLSRDEIKSSGYVIDTLEASLWCFLTTDNFKDCILKAVNLGDDGLDAIPKEWVDSLLGKENIYKLCGM